MVSLYRWLVYIGGLGKFKSITRCLLLNTKKITSNEMINIETLL